MIQAEGISGEPKHYQRGILQGCPQAPAISKLILYRLLKQLVQTHPAVSLQTWVDDVSYGIQGRDPAYVAREALLAFRTLKAELEAAGLCINTDKTGFITSTKEVSKELKLLSTPEDPEHYDVLRDLGVDATATRRRRVMQVKKRFSKGSARTGIMHRLRLAPTTKYRLHRGAIHPVMTWGAQANGLPPQRRQKLRVLAASSPGDVDQLMLCSTSIQSFRIQRTPSFASTSTLSGSCTMPSQRAHSIFSGPAGTALGALLKVRYRWQVVSGPLQALQAYLLDYDFDISNGKQWTRAGYTEASLTAIFPLKIAGQSCFKS